MPTRAWNGAAQLFESEADFRVRGTWENPILLGRISLLNGELSFAGNRYRLSRGDIDFTNPFRLDPVLNVQATTTVQQYEVTLDVSGPASRLALSYRWTRRCPRPTLLTCWRWVRRRSQLLTAAPLRVGQTRRQEQHRFFRKRFRASWAAGWKTFWNYAIPGGSIFGGNDERAKRRGTGDH